MNLERAIEIAVEAHKGVLDKGGNPYVLHPLRMMFAVKTEDEKIVAVLHDVVEDAIDWEFGRLAKEGFSAVIIDALRSVTKVTEHEDYDDFIERAMDNPVGRQVKIADIKDNLDVTRIGELSEKDMTRLNKYKRALEKLTAP
jgi:(p)ppGpp synthase/HD superfamily hydrolase